jgi:surface antigen
MKMRTLAAIAAIALTAALAPATPASAAAATITVTGTINCLNGHEVVGVWIESSAGGSIWADFTKVPGHPEAAVISKKVSIQGSSSEVSLAIGCGGTPKKWWSSNSTKPLKVKAGTVVLNARCTEKAGSGQRCVLPPKGNSVSSTNPWAAYKGWCTYGAAVKWREKVAYYPRFEGDAGKWAASASAHKWTVTSIPSPRSLVVFPGAANHVGYVDAVAIVKGVVKVTITDMNRGSDPDHDFKTTGFNKFTTGTCSADPSWRYILIPLS